MSGPSRLARGVIVFECIVVLVPRVLTLFDGLINGKQTHCGRPAYFWE